jgi:hypothetical protein
MKAKPISITTEAARVAMAHREFEQKAIKIRRKLKARSAVLRHDSRATDEEAYRKLCIADPEMQELTTELAAREGIRDALIDLGCVPAFEHGGVICWTLPEAFLKPN